MYPQYNPGGTPWQRDAFSEGVAAFTGPDRFFPGHRARLHQGRQYEGTAVHVLPEIVVKARKYGYHPYYNPLTDVYSPADRVSDLPGPGKPTGNPASPRNAGSAEKKVRPSQGNRGAFQDIVKGAWQRG